MTDHTEMKQAAEALLGKTIGAPVSLNILSQSHGHNSVFRCEVVADNPLSQSVIVKQGPAERITHEGEALNFIQSRIQGITPHLYAVKDGILVLEDLGEHRSLQERLYDPTQSEQALPMLTLFGEALGTLHAHTVGKPAFTPTHRPMMVDATNDLRARGEAFEALFGAIGVSAHAQFFDDLTAVCTRIIETEDFRVLCHNDLGDHNVLFDGESVTLLDFEFTSYNHALMDAIQPRLGVPAAYRGRRYTNEAIQTFETAYRSALQTGIPQAADDAIFKQALLDATAKMAFSQLWACWKIFISKNMAHGHFSPPELTDNTRYFMRRFISYLHAFIEIGAALPALTETAQQVIERFHGYWADLPEYPSYPALDAEAEPSIWDDNLTG